MADGVGGESTAPEDKMPDVLLQNARPGTLFTHTGDWWTLELGGPASKIPGVPFN